jgi:hypothetical protein
MRARAAPINADPASPTDASALSADTLLQASRRLDWRFLMADPTLAHVAYMGPLVGSLYAALTRFATQVDLIAPHMPATARYDVVVAPDPTGPVLQQAVALVRPGGTLYLEVRNRWPGPRRNRPGWGRPLDYVAALHALGLREVAPYWFWPNFEACTKIVPLHNRSALLYALAPPPTGSGNWGGWQAQGKRWLAQQLVDRGLLEWVVPCFGVLAR